MRKPPAPETGVNLAEAEAFVEMLFATGKTGRGAANVLMGGLAVLLMDDRLDRTTAKMLREHTGAVLHATRQLLAAQRREIELAMAAAAEAAKQERKH